MSLKHGLLGLLNYGNMTGYELDKAFKASLNFFWQAQTSQIYRELNSMEKIGWLSSEMIIQTGKPNKKLYEITDAGKSQLQAWLTESNFDNEFQVRSVFLMKLFFSGEKNPTDTIKILKSYHQACLNALNGLQQTTESIAHYSQQIDEKQQSIYWNLTAEFGKSYFTMCLGWAEQTIKILEELV